MACVSSDALAQNISFANLVYSNLGGLGGSCDAVGKCESLHSAATPHGIYYRQVGTQNGVSWDLRITNATYYLPWNARINGNRRSGAFGVVNVRAPGLQVPSAHPTVTGTRLVFSFLESSTGLPLTLNRSIYISFYDMDTALGLAAVEAIQFGPEVAVLKILN